MLKYRHNPRKRTHCYHYATATGTLCKLENAALHGEQVMVDDPPAGKRLCAICETLQRNIDGGRVVLTTTMLLITIGKLHEGIRPGDETWSKEDEACLHAAFAMSRGI